MVRPSIGVSSIALMVSWYGLSKKQYCCVVFGSQVHWLWNRTLSLGVVLRSWRRCVLLWLRHHLLPCPREDKPRDYASRLYCSGSLRLPCSHLRLINQRLWEGPRGARRSWSRATQVPSESMVACLAETRWPEGLDRFDLLLRASFPSPRKYRLEWRYG